MNKILKKYTCRWCGNEFEQRVAKGGRQGDGKRGDVSDQVKCKCGMFLPTWED